MKQLLLSLTFIALFFTVSRSQTDDCIGATVLTASQLNCATTGNELTGMTDDNTVAGGINWTCIDGTVEIGEWYQFTAVGQDIEILNAMGGANPYVVIVDACPTGPANEIICQQLPILDDVGEGDDLLITGQMYWLWVGYDGAVDDYEICVTNPEAPMNDECAMAENINDRLECVRGTSTTVTGTTINAGPDGSATDDCLNFGTNSWEGVWYQFTAQGNDLVIEDAQGNTPYVLIYDMSPCGNPTAIPVFCDQTPINLTGPNNTDNFLTIGNQYFLFVAFDGGLEQDFTLCVDNPVPPVNDDCITAIDIQANIHCVLGEGDAVQGDIYGAQPDAPGFACLPGSVDFEGIWYTFIVEGHDLLIETSSNEDPYIIIVDDCPLAGALTLFCGQSPIDLGSINDGGPLPTANNNFRLSEIGTRVWMWVGFNGGIDSTFSICIENPVPPDNDLCINSQDISEQLTCIDGSTTVIGTTNYSSFYSQNLLNNRQITSADYDPLLTSPACFNPDMDEVVHYTFEAPGVDFEITDLMDNNPAFAIFEWNDCDEMPVMILCDEMPFSFSEEDDPDDLFDVGKIYHMMIGFPGGWMATDSFELCVNIPEPPINDLCENALIIGPESLDCPDFPRPIIGNTTNASQTGLDYQNIDPMTLPCMIDSTQDDGVWYRFTAIGVDLVITDNLDNNPTILLMQYRPCDDTLALVFCQETPITDDFGAVGNNATTIGQEYLMYVTFQGGETMSDTFELCIDNEGMCSSPTPPMSYCQTTPLCGISALDAYCMNMEDNNFTEGWPGCNVTLHDPNWFSFVAGSNSLSIQVQVSDCMSGSGVQIEMYEIDCTTELGPNNAPCMASDLGAPLGNCIFSETPQPPGSAPIFTVPTVFGHVYGIVFDGWAGDLCTIEIDVIAGADPPTLDGIMLPEPEWDETAFPFEGDTICAGAEDVRFAVQGDGGGVMGACRYDWTLDGMSIPDGTNDFEEFIDFPNPGLYEVCFFASNFCDSTDPVCVEVFVAALDPVVTIDTICEGDDYVWDNPFGGTFDFNPPYDPDQEGLVTYTSMAQNLAGCTVDATLFLYYRPENDQNPTLVDTVICEDQGPFMFHSNDPITTNEGVLENFELDRMLAHDEMCDSFFVLNLYSLFAQAEYLFVPELLNNSEVTCFDSFIRVCPIEQLIFPRQDNYPDVVAEYQWQRLPDGQFMSSTTECLEITIDSFINRVHNFRVNITLSKGGQPEDGCMFGPFDILLDLQDFIPDSLQIIGPDTVCIGPEYNYQLLPFIEDGDLYPTIEGYDWNDPQDIGVTRRDSNVTNSYFTFDQLGNVEICATAFHSCSPGPIHCRTVVVAAPPNPDPGFDAEECTNTYTLAALNGPGTWFTDSGPVGATPPVFADATAISTDVTVVQKGEYRFGYIIEAYGCADTGYVDIDFIEPMSLVAPPVYTCDDVGETYTGVFDFEGGVAPYVVTSANGTLDGMTFTSDPIDQGDTLIVEITDAQDCTGTFVLIFDCACVTEGGTMDLNPRFRCGESCFEGILLAPPPMPDPNDIVVFYLHTNSGSTLGTVVGENLTGEFCYTEGGPIQYGVQYYISVAVGNDLSGSVDLSDRCLDISPGQPITWYEIPAPDAGADDATCGSTYDLNVSNSNYGGVWQVITSETNVTFGDQNASSTTLTALGCGVAQLRWIETNEICSDTTNITIEFYCNPTNTTPTPSCNMAQTELTYSFTLNGDGPFTETNGQGTVTGNMFELDGITLPMVAPITLNFTDGNGCPLEVILPISDCNCLPFVVGDTICGLSTTIVSDGTGNGGEWSVSVDNTGPGTIDLGTPNSRSTTVTVSEYGVYRLTWREDGNLCSSSADIDMYFVNSPEIDLSTLDTVCNSTFDGYVLTFEIINGHLPSYRVIDENGLSLGQVVGNVFTSNEIPSTQPVQFNVFDGFGCDTFTFDFVNDCGCFTDVGPLDDEALNLCVGDASSVIHNPASDSLDGNDVRIYILYSDLNDPIGSFIRQNPSGVFGFMDPPMVIGTTYYISLVAGTEGSPAGTVDFNDPCLSISEALPVTWYDATVPMISQSDAEFTCVIEQITLGVTADDIDDYDITWSTTNGTIEPGDENSMNPRINSPGTYTVTLSHSIAGCPSTATITIDQSNDVPDAEIDAPLLLTCDRDQITLSGQNSDQGPTIRFEWSGPGIVGPNDGIDIIVDATGIYTLTLIDESNNCEVTTTVEVREDITPPEADAESLELLDCNTTQVTVSGAGSDEGSDIRYAWSVVGAEGNIVGSTTGRDITVDRPGNYEITVTNTSNGCTNTAIARVDADPSVIRSAIVDFRQPGCDGVDDGSITIASVDGGTGPFMYSFNGGTDFSTTPALNNLGAGVYDIVITDANDCVYTDRVVLVAPIDFSVDLGETVLVDFGDFATITGVTDLPDSLILSITWSPLYDSLNPESLTQTFLPDLGQQNVELTIVNLNGCVERGNVLVVAKFAERIYIPTAMYPNSGNPENERIYIFANPESVEAIHSFAIYNRWGERMFLRGEIPPSLTIDPAYAWDGMWRDEEAPGGVYVYYAEVEFITGVQKVIKGEFTLMR